MNTIPIQPVWVGASLYKLPTHERRDVADRWLSENAANPAIGNSQKFFCETFPDAVGIGSLSARPTRQM